MGWALPPRASCRRRGGPGWHGMGFCLEKNPPPKPVKGASPGLPAQLMRMDVKIRSGFLTDVCGLGNALTTTSPVDSPFLCQTSPSLADVKPGAVLGESSCAGGGAWQRRGHRQQCHPPPDGLATTAPAEGPAEPQPSVLVLSTTSEVVSRLEKAVKIDICFFNDFGAVYKTYHTHLLHGVSPGSGPLQKVDSGPKRTLKSFRETGANLMKVKVRNETWCFAVKHR
ncbi:uncharacterized protein [Pithys albifrons albifrons]|uniref:uncharacterized protein n=1 Tax=Pithys albifrons albifrons TaxID=3385563 RepID=UPI003A5CEE89